MLFKKLPLGVIIEKMHHGLIHQDKFCPVLKKLIDNKKLILELKYN